MKARLDVSPRAQVDLERIFGWLEARSPEGASRWFDAFTQAADRLSDFLLAWPRARESIGLPQEVRDMQSATPHGRTYRALYTVDDVVHILCIRGPGGRPVRLRDLEP